MILLQELIEDYESQQDLSSSEEGDLGEYYYYEYYEDGDDEDGGTAAEQDTEDPLVAQPTTTSQEWEQNRHSSLVYVEPNLNFMWQYSKCCHLADDKLLCSLW